MDGSSTTENTFFDSKTMFSNTRGTSQLPQASYLLLEDIPSTNQSNYVTTTSNTPQCPTSMQAEEVLSGLPQASSHSCEITTWQPTQGSPPSWRRVGLQTSHDVSEWDPSTGNAVPMYIHDVPISGHDGSHLRDDDDDVRDTRAASQGFRRFAPSTVESLVQVPRAFIPQAMANVFPTDFPVMANAFDDLSKADFSQLGVSFPVNTTQFMQSSTQAMYDTSYNYNATNTALDRSTSTFQRSKKSAKASKSPKPRRLSKVKREADSTYDSSQKGVLSRRSTRSRRQPSTEKPLKKEYTHSFVQNTGSIPPLISIEPITANRQQNPRGRSSAKRTIEQANSPSSSDSQWLDRSDLSKEERRAEKARLRSKRNRERKKIMMEQLKAEVKLYSSQFEKAKQEKLEQAATINRLTEENRNLKDQKASAVSGLKEQNLRLHEEVKRLKGLLGSTAEYNIPPLCRESPSRVSDKDHSEVDDLSDSANSPLSHIHRDHNLALESVRSSNCSRISSRSSLEH